MTTRHRPFDPLSFGRRQPFRGAAMTVTAPAVSEDLRLFVMTYVAGFAFVSLFLA